jgi:outer membrane protein OmpA-like peptidoglycan-associated protein
MNSLSAQRQLHRSSRTWIARLFRVLVVMAMPLINESSFAADFGDQTPTVEQLIEALNSPGAEAINHGNVKTRGIKIVTLDHRLKPPATADGSPPSVGGRASMVIQFALNSDRILRASADSLNNLATALSSDSLKDRPFEVIGHTDSSGPASYNLKLSKRRAQSVAEFLSVIGVDASRATASGRGPTELLSGIAPDSARQRRVEIRIIR